MNYNNYKLSKNVHEIKKLEVELTLENLTLAIQLPNNRISYEFKTALNDNTNRFIKSYIVMDYKYAPIWTENFSTLRVYEEFKNSQELWDFMFCRGASAITDEHVIDCEIVPCPELFRMEGGKKNYSFYEPNWCEVNYSIDPSELKFENINGVIIQSIDAEHDLRQSKVLSNDETSFQICIEEKSDLKYLVIDAITYRKFLEHSSTLKDHTSAYLKLHTEQ